MRSRDDPEEASVRKENFAKHTNWLSKWTFWYTIKILKQGYKREFEEADLTEPLDEHRSDYLGERLCHYWIMELRKAEESNEEPHLSTALYQCFKKPIFVQGFSLLCMEMCVVQKNRIRMLQPIFLGLLMRYYAKSNKTKDQSLHYPMYLSRLLVYWTDVETQSPIQYDEACIYTVGVIFCSVFVALTVHPIFLEITHLGMKMRVACCSMIYRKALRLNLEATKGQTVGSIVNLMSNDVNRFDMGVIFFHYLWIAPLQMFLTLYFLYKEVGMSAVIGIMSILTFIPIQVWFGNRTAAYRTTTAEKTDGRIQLMNELIQAMQVIKMYTWENTFADMIHRVRKEEIRMLRYTSYIKGVVMSFIMFITRLGIFLTVASFVLRERDITAENVFVVTAYYQILRQTMTVWFPQGVANIAECHVAVGRIKNLMLMDESQVGDRSPLEGGVRHSRDDFLQSKLSSKLSVNLVSRSAAKLSQPLLVDSRRSRKSSLDSFFNSHTSGFGYLNTKDKRAIPEIRIQNASAKFGNVVCLENIRLVVKVGQLTAIIGQVGAGKSCILHLILGELQPFIGRVHVQGVISYAAQEPWLFAGTVRQNILFGREYQRRKYKEVVRVCALERDFNILPFGDKTIVGERGISLSGGQRARINLARAVYKEADVYLLDDPLSAVDSHVGKQLFDECIAGYLSNKVVILVTHQLQYLQNVDQIVLVEEGVIELKGDYESLQKSGLNFAEFLKDPTDDDHEEDDTEEGAPKSRVSTLIKHLSKTSKMSLNVVNPEGTAKLNPVEEAEMKTEGSIGCFVYKKYLRAGGNYAAIFIMFLMYLLAQTIASFGDFFLCAWAKTEETRNTQVAQEPPVWGVLSTRTSVIVYTSLMLGTIFIAITRSFIFFMLCNRASIRLHNDMFNSVITARMSFFNANTSGRILNRFSKDLGAIDEFLPNAMIDTVQVALNLLGVIVLVIIISPVLAIPVVVIAIGFYYLRKHYLCTSRSIKRLDGIARSPCFAHLNATLQGLTTIRSNGAEVKLTNEFDHLQDIHSSAWFMFIATSRAFGYWSDLICSGFVAAVSFSFLFLDETGSDVGLCITQTLGLTGLFQWGIRQSAELENQMTSVERILEFITRIEHETNLKSDPGQEPPADWPKEGEIIFENVNLRYRPQDNPVLKNLNMTIRAREKIGIVGRTGAGKSSLMSALFRLAYYDGKVVIDGLDTSSFGLHDLRRKISIIPQEPVLFSGTLRYNLDPFNEFTDDQITRALIVVEIKVALIEGAACLNWIMSEGGVNISVGERQMVCLARAILRNNVILVLDEATANIDPQTDQFIQTTIRTKFSHCTVLTIAHRLNTIMDSDKVLVMDAGKKVEFDQPHILLQDPNGYFSKMVDKTGQQMASHLREIALKCYKAGN